jgi:hypothetical protein
MKTLVSLPGIEAPTASAILHLLFPDDYPIYDVRTIETLYHFGYLNHKKKDFAHYPEFRRIILNLKKKMGSGKSLRDIDCALFAFHKLQLNKPGSSQVCDNSKY